RCLERGTPGAGSGPRRRAGRKTGAAPRADFTEVDPLPCPRLAPHPPGRTAACDIHLKWDGEAPPRIRVVEYTCSCRVIVYELLRCSGLYIIRRTHQTTPAKVAYAGPWRHRVAGQMWTLILTGEAC
ncbi:hypothetical protein ACFXJ8_21965, partial [Nonomuraea sp. NPDC059194]